MKSLCGLMDKEVTKHSQNLTKLFLTRLLSLSRWSKLTFSNTKAEFFPNRRYYVCFGKNSALVVFICEKD